MSEESPNIDITDMDLVMKKVLINQEVIKLTAEIKALELTLLKTYKEMAAYKSAVNENELNSRYLSTNIANAQNTITILQEEIKAKNATISSLEERVNQNMAFTKARIAKVKQRMIDDKERALDQLEREYAKEFKELQEAHSKEVAELNNALLTKKDLLEKLKFRLSSMEDSQEKSIKAARERLKKEQAAILFEKDQELKRVIAQADEKERSLVQDLITANVNLDHLSKTVDKLKRKRMSYYSRIAKRIKGYNDKIVSLSLELDSRSPERFEQLLAINASLKESLQKETAEKEQLCVELLTLQAKINNLVQFKPE